MVMSDPDQSKRLSRPKILFLRSSTQATFAAFITGGLHYASFDFMQYPPIPDNRLDKLNKLYDQAEAREHLQRNLIATKKELKKKIDQHFFDIILLLDYNASLFSYMQMNRLKKIRNLFGQVKFFFRKNTSEILEELNYIQGIPFTPSALSNKIPLAVIDLDDWICLPPSGQELLQVCSSYYKRELPFNRFFLYYQERPAPWRLWREKLSPICEKVINIPLGIENKKYYSLKKIRSDKQNIDIFYCGAATSTVRIKFLEYLHELTQATDWNIVIADSLPFVEYCKTIARSKITLSISGGGWDCFRHYEAVALGSIPLMDKPNVDTFWWNKAPEELFFASTFKDFRLKIDQLLTDATLRKRCFSQVESIVESYMLHSKIVQYIVYSSLNKQSVVS